jgi:hypothetical protein
MHAIMSVEPVREHDKVMMGMIKALGIERGKPFAPDETAKRAMRQAAIDAWYYLQWWYDNFPADKLYWPDRHYASLLQADDNRAFTFTYGDRIDLTERAAEYFWCTYMPKMLIDNPARNISWPLPTRMGSCWRRARRTRSMCRRTCRS